MSWYDDHYGTDTRVNEPWWQAAGRRLIGAVWQGHAFDQEKVLWLEDIIKNAYGNDADLSKDALGSEADVNDLVYNVGLNHWNRETVNAPGFSIDPYSPHSPQYSTTNYTPTEQGVWENVNQEAATQTGWDINNPILNASRGPDFDYRVPGEVGGGPHFGRADYRTLLESVADASSESTEELIELRGDVLHFLENYPDPGKVYDLNAEDGIYQQIQRNARSSPYRNDQVYDRNATSNMTAWFGYTTAGDPTPETKFNRTDVLAAKAGGFDDFDIWVYMRNNKHLWQGVGGGERQFEEIEQRLIERGNRVLDRRGTNPNYYYDYGQEIMKHPYFYQAAEYANTLGEDVGNVTSGREYYRLVNWLQGQTGENIYHFRTEEKFRQLVGGPATGDPQPGTIGWEEGDYWKQWGATGRNLDDEAGPDLTEVQKLVASAGIYADDPGQAEERIEYLENAWLQALYHVPGTTGGGGSFYRAGDPLYLTASDEWGLDIMRLDADGNSLDQDFFESASWDENNELENASWFRTLTQGRIDWAFYDENREFQRAREVLGLEGTYSEHKQVAEIRAANIWVHGQHALLEATEDDPSLDWTPYEADFDPDTATPWVPRDLSIMGYARQSRRDIRQITNTLTSPEVNIARNEIRVPDRLQEWDTTDVPAPTSPATDTLSAHAATAAAVL